MRRRVRYLFGGRSDDGTYYWESVDTLPNDSRGEQVTCSARWFWSTAGMDVAL